MSSMDVVAVLACGAAAALTAFGIFGNVQGGGLPASGWFAWHPVFMSLAFPCLMPLGRWSYIGWADWSAGKPERRQLHRGIMGAAAFAAVLGYLFMFMAHLPGRVFFGHDFKTGEWHEWKRVLHVWVGYLTILLTVAQACMGIMKMSTWQEKGEKIMTFHGDLGKVIVGLGTLSMILAISFWGWSLAVKIPLLFVVCVACALGTLWPKADNDSDASQATAEEATELKSS